MDNEVIMDNRKEIYEKLKKKYPNLVWNSKYMLLLKMSAPFIRRFPIAVKFEEKLPEDGVLIFVQNHCNIYDSLVLDIIMKGYDYFCFAGDEPRHMLSGKVFEAKGVVWINRSSAESRKDSMTVLEKLAESGFNLSLCPEGTWCLDSRDLILTIPYGVSKIAINVSKKVKVYIVPIVTDYNYLGNTNKVIDAITTVCKPIGVISDMDYKKLNEILTDTLWTARWMQLEKRAAKSNETIKIDSIYDDNCTNHYVFKRKNYSVSDWEEHVCSLESQYKVDWNVELGYRFKTKERLEQEEVEADLEKIKNGMVLQKKV